jgi:hypothetical protein
MRRLTLAVLLGLIAGAAGAVEMADAPGAKLRVLDKLSGAVEDVVLARGQSMTTGRITVQLDACRSPADNTTAEAQAHLTVIDAATPEPVFAGWMIATAPALSALEHPRYDVWVLRCDVPELALPEVEDPVEGETAPDDEAVETDADNG